MFFQTQIVMDVGQLCSVSGTLPSMIVIEGVGPT